MRFVVETREGTVVVEDLSQEASSCELATRVLSSLKYEKGSVDPSHHVLVCNGRRIRDMSRSLQKQGIDDRSSLVLLKKRTTSPIVESGMPSVPTPEQIELVVRAEAARQGREILPPTIQSARTRDSEPLESRLHGIMQALHNMTSAAALNDEMHSQVNLALSQASRMSRDDEGSSRPSLAEEVVVPEPNSASIERLLDMGFSHAAARRALLLSSNSVAAAAHYLIAHSGDSDIEAEPTMQELREVYRARNVRLAEPRQVQASPEHMQLLLDMGFTEAGSRHALIRNDNNVEAAINLLTGRPAGWEPSAEEAGTRHGPSQSENVGEAESDDLVVLAPVNVVNQSSEQIVADSSNRTTDGQTEAQNHSGVSLSNVPEELRAEHVRGSTGSDGNAESSVHSVAELAIPVRETDEAAIILGTPGVLRSTPHEGTDRAVDSDPNANGGLIDNGRVWGTDRTEPGRHNSEPAMEETDDVVSIVGQVPEVQSEGDDDANRRGEQFESQDSLFGNMMDIREGMRGIITALSGVDGGTMSGALPILSTGSGEDGILDHLRIVDDMSWGGSLPGLIGPLIDEEQVTAEQSDQFEDGFLTDTTFTNASGQDDGRRSDGRDSGLQSNDSGDVESQRSVEYHDL